MKKIVISTLVIAPIALLVVYGAFLFFQNPENTDITTNTSSNIVYCTATSEKVCYVVTCDTGTVTTIDIPAPGSVPYQCSNDSKLRMTEI